MRPFSICIIAKNEEKNIEKCLHAVQYFDCEIIVVDTGSTDKTVEIAEKYATKVLNFPWIKDFSAARNFSIENASYDWILVLDCDEFVESASPDLFLEMGQANPTFLGLLERINLTNSESKRGSYTDRIPRFFNRNYFRYEGSIHEQVCPLEPRDLKGYYLPLTVVHTGYIGTPEEIRAKHMRNLTMLQHELTQNPYNPYIHFQIGQSYYNLFDYETAQKYFKFVVDSELLPNLEYHRLSVISYFDCLLNTGQIQDALEMQHFSNDFGYTPDFHFLMGQIYYAANEPFAAMKSFITATSMDNPCKEGTNTYLPWFHIGLINESFGNLTSATLFYEKCGDFAPAVERLQNLQIGE